METQIQGAVIDALGAALRQKVTIRHGRAEQSNFCDYPLLRIEEAPRVTVSIVEIGFPLGGVGEPGVPPSRARSCQCALRSHPATGSEPPVLRSRIRRQLRRRLRI